MFLKNSVYNKISSGVYKTVISNKEAFKRIIITRDLQRNKVSVDFFVAGYKYSDGLEMISVLSEGEKIELVREVHNPFDPNAVAVYTYDYVKLGYIPRFMSSFVAERMENEKTIKAKIKKINAHKSHSDDIRIETRITFSV